jgi:NarL family two-component system response regulator YdfI
MTSAPIRVLIADDHEIVREGLRLILASEDGIEVIAEAEDGERAVALTTELAPDVVLMDVRMPKLGGIEAVRRIRRDAPAVEVVILTMFDEDDVMLDGLQSGARGYLMKDTDRATLVNTIRAAARGEALMGSESFDKLVAKATRRAGSFSSPRSGAPERPRSTLTHRELQVLEAVTDGEKTRQVAQRFGISERTVKAHLASIYAKLDVDSRAAAVAKAIRRGLVPDE